MVGAIQAVLALESSVAEGPTLQLELLLLSMSLEEKGVRELECLHRTDSRSGFSGGLSTMVIIHFLWRNRRVCQLNHFWQDRQTDFSFACEVVLKAQVQVKLVLESNATGTWEESKTLAQVALLLRSEDVYSINCLWLSLPLIKYIVLNTNGYIHQQCHNKLFSKRGQNNNI